MILSVVICKIGLHRYGVDFSKHKQVCVRCGSEKIYHPRITDCMFEGKPVTIVGDVSLAPKLCPSCGSKFENYAVGHTMDLAWWVRACPQHPYIAFEGERETEWTQ